MASGDTLLELHPLGNEYSGTDAAVLAKRNGIWVLVYTKDVSDDAIWTRVMPSYGSTGITAKLHVTSPATSGNMDWDVALSRLTALDIDGHTFGSAISVDNTNINGTSGIPTIVSVALLTAEMDSVVAGDWFQIKITRDGSPDTTDDDLQLGFVEIQET